MQPTAEDGHVVAAQLAQMQLNEATAPGLACWQERQTALLARHNDDDTHADVRDVLPMHLVVLVHGNNGHPTDFDAVAAALVAQFPPGSIAILQSRVNMRQKTRAGIAQCGHRLALEVLDWLLTFRVSDASPRRLSMLGHSFGGLIARHCLPFLLHTLSEMHIQPTSFVTLCTPHLGSRKPGGSLPRVFSKWLVHRILLTQRLYGQTGLDLLVLGTSTDQATLEAMSARDSVYVQALAAFEHRTAIGLATGDHLVAHAASTISLSCTDETNRAPKAMWSWAVEYNDFAPAHEFVLAPPLPTPLELERRVECVPQLRDGYIADARRRIAFSKSMLHGLQSVGWRRMHLHIRAPLQHWFKLHNWPLSIRQAPSAEPSSKAFVDLLVATVAVDHGLVVSAPTKQDV